MTQSYLGTDSFRNISKRVDTSSADGLFRGAKHLQQLEADAHPLARRHELGPAVRDATYQVHAVLLHLFVAVLEDGR